MPFTSLSNDQTECRKPMISLTLTTLFAGRGEGADVTGLIPRWILPRQSSACRIDKTFLVGLKGKLKRMENQTGTIEALSTSTFNIDIEGFITLAWK